MLDAQLGLARVDGAPLQRTAVDLSALALEIADELKLQQPWRCVEVRVQEGLVVRGDPDLLRSALWNLIGNAWKYTARQDVARIEIGAESGAEGWTGFVRDNGTGFDPGRAASLFTAFGRLHPEQGYEGTGLGLASVQRIVQRHGGRIWARSTPGEGATFSFTLDTDPPRLDWDAEECR